MGDYERHGQSRPYGPTYSGGPYEYTGQPVGFEHLGSPPKQRLEDMDPKTIAQLGYEGPEGERRKAEAINEQMNERIYERERDAYNHPVPMPVRPPRSEYRDGYSDSRERYYPDQRYRRDDEYYGGGSRHGDYDRYNQGRPGPGYMIPSPVTVDRKVQEDGTVVEHVYPDNRVVSPYQRPDRNKIHYGRQDSFPEAALQEAAAYNQRYPSSSAYPGSSGYAGHPAPHTSASSPYGRRPPNEYGNPGYDDRHRY